MHRSAEVICSVLSKWLLVVVSVSIVGCVPITNRTSYHAFSVVPAPGKSSAAITDVPIVSFGLTRQLTSKIYPFVDYLGEKGDFALSVYLHGIGAKPYQGLILRSAVIESGGRVHFEMRDSAFVRFKPPYKQYGVHALRNEAAGYFYESGYVVALPDSVKRPYLKAEYDLVRWDNGHERRTLYTRCYIDRARGLYW